ncbi:MAG: uroporphyrinogen-III synthase [Actinomycetota bacterium]
MAGSARGLEGVRVVVTRPRRDARRLGDPLRDRGALVIYLPLLEIVDPQTWNEVDAALRRLADGGYDWVAFTSGNAVDRLLRRIETLGLPSRAMSGTRVAAVGRTTAASLQRRGVQPDLVPGTSTGEALAEALGSGPGRVLLPRVERGPRAIVRDLRERGWEIDEVTAYRNLRGRVDTPEGDDVKAGSFDIVTFASGSAARAFVHSVSEPGALGLALADAPKRVVACIGPRTAQAARAAGFRVDVQALEHSAGGLVRALSAWLAR